MLSLSELMPLTLKEKAQYVCNYGMYCNSSWEGKYKVNLYWLGTFYVQVWQDNHSHQIRGIVVKEALPCY